jgi:hypothetical protein
MLEKEDMVVFDVDNNHTKNRHYVDGKIVETDENGVISIIEDVKSEERRCKSRRCSCC